MNDINQYYEILSLDSSASLETVKQAYRNLAKIWHPDYCIKDSKLKAQSETQIKKINQAYAAIKSYLELKQNCSTYVSFNHQPEISIHKRTPDFYYLQGVNYAENNNNKDALDSFALAIKLDSDYVKAYQYRGFILSKLGYEHRAKVEFEKASQVKKKQKQKPYSSNKTKAEAEAEAGIFNKNEKSIIKCCKSISAANNSITSIVISPDNKTFASISNSKEINIWNIDTGKKLAVLQGHTDIISSLAIDNRGTILVSAGKDKNIRFWNLETQKITKTLGGKFNFCSEAVLALYLCPDKRTLLSYNANNTIQVWDIKRAKLTQSISIPANLTCLKVSPNCQLFCTGSLEPQLRIRQVNNGQVIRSINNYSGVVCLAFSPDGNMLATGGVDRSIRIWNINTGTEIHTFTGHLDRLSSLIFSLDGRTLISAGWDKKIKVWQLETGKQFVCATAHLSKITSIAIASDNQTFVTGDERGEIKIWRCFF